MNHVLVFLGSILCSTLSSMEDTRSASAQESRLSQYTVERIADNQSGNELSSSSTQKKRKRSTSPTRHYGYHDATQCACEAPLNSNSDLLDHVKIHWHNYHYECPVCVYKNCYLSRFIWHMSEHTGELDSPKEAKKSGDYSGVSKTYYENEPDTIRAWSSAIQNLIDNPHNIPQQHVVPEQLTPEIQHYDRQTIKNLPAENYDRQLPVIDLVQEDSVDIPAITTACKNNTIEYFIINDDETEGPKRCVCGVSFANHQLLKEHISSHKVPALYECTLCSYLFTESALLEHLPSHTGENPYACSFCSLSFEYQKDRNQHEKNIHVDY